ncbi:ATP-dependent helicase [Thermofilum pendens]|uniref:DEAD/H associated domain protein n=1 Tax=Thermofilum pendens (strain DSM 2475 / Hrk 5) TaxID=368408 RepID=A1RYQ1_THEPD|nr:ATP-dependent helicase [Thermofilum pendens]ABL78331.1 DEAD/H associated domain protein [Thermofilum pendens Hrk 5]
MSGKAISFATREYSKEEVLRVLDPLVAEWFSGKFEDLTPPQRYALIPIHEGKNVLVSSPTGTGKTLTAFLIALSELFGMARRGELEDTVYVVYVSPLRALNNDIYRNLEEPLREIRELAEKRGLEIPEIRHMVRTGDTSSSQRQSMLRKPPHILITTPETLAIILVAPKFREKLRSVKWVIVDEIHSLAENKRGVHLALSLERLRELVGRDFVRIGLSATINPLEEVAQFLVGYNDDGSPRECVIVDARYAKRKTLRVVSPVPDLVHTPAQEVTAKLYETLYEIVRKHRTTLIFTNTRSGTERVVFHLKQLARKRGDIPEDAIAAHHSSLSRNVRLDVEEKLKRGELRAIVSSTSLELGIDIGYIDVVVLVGSPKSVTRALQRIGRSGHRLHETSKGVFVCVDRDDLVEVAVMTREAYRHHLDRVHIPRNALDVLAQHLVGMAIERKMSAEEAYRIVRRSYPYRDLPWEDFENVLKFLSGGYGELEEYKVYGKIWYDPEEKVFGRRGKYARVIYTLNVGTIPDEVSVKVLTLDRKYVGNIEEEFLERLMPGDRFVLGGKVYEFVKSDGLTAYVKPAYEQKPTIPAWFSEMLPLSYDLAVRIGEFRGQAFEWISKPGGLERLKEYLKRECKVNEEGAEAVAGYFLEEYLFLRSLGVEKFPSDRVVLVERYRDADGRVHHVFHTLFGRRTNDALSHALAYLASKRAGANIGIAVHDNGFALIYPPGVEPQVSLMDVAPSELEDILKKAVFNTELMRRRFRHVATRGLMILRNYKGHEISVEKQQLSAGTLLRVIRKWEDFPILKETFREILEDYMDIAHAREVLEKVHSGEIEVVDIGLLDTPTPFAYNIILEGLSDVVLMEDKRALIAKFHEELMRKIARAKAQAQAAR